MLLSIYYPIDKFLRYVGIIASLVLVYIRKLLKYVAHTKVDLNGQIIDLRRRWEWHSTFQINLKEYADDIFSFYNSWHLCIHTD